MRRLSALVVIVAALLVQPGAEAEATDARAALAAIGPLHVEPIRFAPNGARPETWVGIIGDKTSSRAAFVARMEHGKPRTLQFQLWPAGTRVLATHVEGDGAWILCAPPRLPSVKSTANVVVAVNIAASEAPMVYGPESMHAELGGAADGAELLRRIAAHAPVPHETPPPADRQAAAKATAKAISKQGLDVYRVRQATWLEPVEHVDAAAFAKSPYLKRVHDIVAHDSCMRATCFDEERGATGNATPQVRFVLEDGRWVARMLIELPETSPPVSVVTTGKPRAVLERSDGARTKTALREQRGVADAKVLGEAPLDRSAGIIGVAMAGNVPVVVATVDGMDRVFSLDEDPWANPHVPPKIDVRFGDLDGDGRTDLALWTDGGEAPSLPFAAAFFAPAPTIEAVGLRRDLASELALFGAKDAEEALTRALAVPRKGPTRDEVCKLFGGKTDRAAWQRAATKDARVFRFSGYLPHTWRPDAVLTGAKIGKDDLRGFGERCKRLQCMADGPVCAHDINDPHDNAGKALSFWTAGFYWFVREGNGWRVAAFSGIGNGMSSPGGGGGGGGGLDRSRRD